MPYIPLSRDGHANKAWRRYMSYRFAAEQAVVPIVVAEVLKAASSMPLAFVLEGNAPLLVAVLSLQPRTNSFVASDGRWLGGYIPASLRGYPFALLSAQGSESQFLCVDSAAIVERGQSGAEPFFDADGSLHASVRAVVDFLKHVEASRGPTARAVEALMHSGLLQEWPLEAKTPRGSTVVNGLLRLNEAKLDKLHDVDFLRLRVAGALQIGYAQLFSTAHLGIFETLSNLQEQISHVHLRQQAAFERSLDNPMTDAIQFDFSRL